MIPVSNQRSRFEENQLHVYFEERILSVLVHNP